MTHEKRHRRRRLRRKIQLRFRLATAGLRGLPHFLIIGAQKSGTTSLFKFICQHPRILPAIRKEVHFFDGGLNPERDHYQNGERWYRAHFPFEIGLRRGRITGEASPLYLFSPLAAQRIRHTIPDVKLIALLRNPTDRAISHYFHEVRKGRESASILEALKQEDSRLAKPIAAKDFKNSAFLHASYKSRGLYYAQLRRYFRYFDPRQVLVLQSESFFANPRQTLQQVFRFLGIDPAYGVSDLRPRNVRKKAPVSASVYDYLNDFFHRPNKKLFTLLQKTFNWQSD